MSKWYLVNNHYKHNVVVHLCSLNWVVLMKKYSLDIFKYRILHLRISVSLVTLHGSISNYNDIGLASWHGNGVWGDVAEEATRMILFLIRRPSPLRLWVTLDCLLLSSYIYKLSLIYLIDGCSPVKTHCFSSPSSYSCPYNGCYSHSIKVQWSLPTSLGTGSFPLRRRGSPTQTRQKLR